MCFTASHDAQSPASLLKLSPEVCGSDEERSRPNKYSGATENGKFYTVVKMKNSKYCYKKKVILFLLIDSNFTIFLL